MSEIQEKKQEEIELVRALGHAMRSAELPDLKAIVCSFFRKLGGHDAFADILLENFRESQPGSQSKMRIFEMILQASKTITQKEGSRDVNLLSDADLDRELRSLLAKVPDAGKFAGVK